MGIQPDDHSTVFDAFQHFSENKNDSTAREALLKAVSVRMENLSRKMLHSNKVVERWEETMDISQQASVKLWRAMGDAPIADVPHLLRIMAMQIRNVLKDRYRKYAGPEGIGRHHYSEAQIAVKNQEGNGGMSPLDACGEWDQSLESVDLHDIVERLSEEDQEIVNLLYYHGMSQTEAAAVLNISDKTVRRRWQRARLALADALEAGLASYGRLE